MTSKVFSKLLFGDEDVTNNTHQLTDKDNN